MKNKLYVMCGIPGSGKSTFAKSHFPTALYVSRDEIRFSLVKENEEYFSKEREVFITFVKQINEGLREHKDVIADATHLNKKSRNKLLSALNIDLDKVQIEIIYLQTPLELCLKNNETRKDTRSYVPKDVILNMSRSFQYPSFLECNGLINTIHTIKINWNEE